MGTLRTRLQQLEMVEGQDDRNGLLIFAGENPSPEQAAQIAEAEAEGRIVINVCFVGVNQ